MDEMNINQDQYRQLGDSQKDTDIALAEISIKLTGACAILERVEHAVYGNGDVGLRAEVELLKEKDKGKIDWKWIGMLLLQAVLIAIMAGLLAV